MMNIKITPVTRDNWLEAMDLRVSKEQCRFVPEVAVSLAKVYIKPDGDSVQYLPFAIYDGEKMVGFMMHAYEEDTHDMYWINGFLIDQQYQGKGYGKQAMKEMMKYIISRFPQCKEIRLTVNVDNKNAQSLYTSLSFIETGECYDKEIVYKYVVTK